MAVTANKHHVISKIAHGWGDIEAPIIAFAAARLPFLMQGMHGNAKTSVGKLLGFVYGNDSFRYVDCAKANLISMCGFPDMDKMKAGEQAFVPNNRSLIGSDKYKVDVALLDEITRAPKEVGNQLLEFIESGTIYGIPTGVKLIIATCNPDSYKGATKMDAALLDRFVACLPINDFKEVSSDDVEAMIRINIKQELDPKYVENTGKELKRVVEAVAKKYQELIKDTDVQDRIGAYAANMVSMCKAKWNAAGIEGAPYISGREAASQFWRAIIALAAYYMEVYKRDPGLAYVDAARDAIKYCWIVKHGMEESFSRAVETVHREMIFLLRQTAKGAAGKVGMAYAKAMTPQAKLNFWEQHLTEVTKHCDASMMTEMMSGTMTSIDDYVPATAPAKKSRDKDMLSWRARLYGISKQHKDFTTTADSLEGQLVCQLITGMNAIGATLDTAPYKHSLCTDVIDSSNITDLLVGLTSNKVGNARI